MMDLSKKCKNREHDTTVDTKQENRQVARSFHDEKQKVKNVTNDMFTRHNSGEDNNAGLLPDDGKSKARCPRCHAIIGQIQCLLQSVPVECTRETDIADICFCAKAQPCSCTQCGELVKKFIAATEAALYHDKFKFKYYLELWLKEKNTLLQLARMDKNQVKHAFDRGLVSLSVNDLRDDLEVQHILQRNNNAPANRERLNTDTTKSQCYFKVPNTSKLDYPVLQADKVRLMKSDLKKNVLRLHSGPRNNAQQFSKNVNHKKTYIPKTFKGNILKNNQVVPTIQPAKTMQSVPYPLSLETKYQDKNKKTKISPEINKNKQEKYMKDSLHHKSDRVDKSEINDLKINKMNKNNTNLETNIKKQSLYKYITQNLPLELKLNGINDHKKNNSNAKHFVKTINDKMEENTINTKLKKNLINNRLQILNSKGLRSFEVNILKVTKKTIHYDEDDIEENVKSRKNREGQSQDDKPRGLNHTETKEPITINKYKSSNNKTNENLVLHTNDMTVSKYREKAYSDRANNLQVKIVKDLITSSLPTKFCEERKKPSPQKIKFSNRKCELAHFRKHSPKRNLEKERSVNDYLEGKGNKGWTNDTKEIKSNQEYKKRQCNNGQNTARDAHQRYQTKKNTMGQTKLPTSDLQPVNHLRGGGPIKLSERSKTSVIENKIIDRNINKIQGVQQTKKINILKEPRQQILENKKYTQQQQINEHLQILKDIIGDVGLHKEDKRRWVKLRKIETLPILSAHASHKFKMPGCVICQDSELSLNIEALKNPPKFEFGAHAYIKNNKLFTSKTKPSKIIDETFEKNKPFLFKRTYNTQEPRENTEYEESDTQNNRDGTIHYTLSEREFIDKGWTVLPVEKIIRKLNLYRMRPAHPQFNWFEQNKLNGYITYTTGEKLVDFDQNGHGRWYYKSGQVALDYYECEDLNEQRIVIYSHDGDVDQSGRSYPLTVLAIFDYTGNGIVFDHNGKIRLKYNQSEGLVLDRAIGPISRWKWHSLNNSPNLEKVVINTTLEPRDENIIHLGVDEKYDNSKPKQINNEMIAVELDNVVKEHQKAGNLVFEQFQIKTKALRINKQFSLRILDQEKIHITLRDGPTHLKLNIGMVLDNSEVISVLTEELGEISNSVEKEPADTSSMEKLQSYIDAARLSEKIRAERLQPLC